MQTALTQEEFEELVLSVGIHRKRRKLRPVEVARRIKRALEAGVLHGSGVIQFSIDSLAKRLGFKGASMISRFLTLLNIPEEFQEIVEWGSGSGAMSHLTFSIASTISTLPPDQQRQFFLEVFKHELTKLETISVVQTLKRNPSKSVRDAAHEVLGTRPVKVYHEVLIGSFPPESAMASSSLPTGRKEAVLNAVLKPIFGNEAVAGRVSAGHFLISTSEQGKRALLERCKRLGVRPNDLITKLCEDRLSS